MPVPAPLPTPPLRVLFVEGHLRENGGLRVVLDLARRFVADGVETTVFALEDVTGAATARPDPGVRLVFGARAGSPAPRRLPRELVRLVREARRHDLVVSGSEIGHGVLAGWLAARVTGRPFVVLAQGDLDQAIEAWVPPHLRRATRFADAHADATVCVSPGLVPGIVANGQSPERTHVVVNGVDVEALRARAARRPARRGAEPQVVALGRLTPHKGFDLLLRASAAVRARGLDHALTIAGEGDGRAALEALAAELGADHVSFPGFTAHPESVLAGADLFVSSSRTEAMPLTLLEALSLAVPVVATDCSVGSRMLLDDGELGRLVEPESVEALTEALAAHLTDPRPLREAAARGPEFARRFDPQRLAREHLAILFRTAGVPLPRRLAGAVPGPGRARALDYSAA
ncbi:glycosyltransferase involved in cell wall biosynthesis [Kineococcus radiotolerans]|uniref:Glycosyltransferase involved in cell wall biosynthesis n=1 Tax=Kineococcus radiotolerans TaxID=131568 RepID=A0A7W4XYQ7_KINRA|nr:glycosyltransferase [Kineococcus radiotolerans]MBB2902792.1 glycosyltransferase involved in cell wall biosynthesis [Kineococcus radiotolerans]